MPLREYVCPKGHKMEELQGNTEPMEEVVRVCVACGGHVQFFKLIPSVPNLNTEFPTQAGGVHSMAGFGRRRRDRQGD